MQKLLSYNRFLKQTYINFSVYIADKGFKVILNCTIVPQDNNNNNNNKTSKLCYTSQTEIYSVR